MLDNDEIASITIYKQYDLMPTVVWNHSQFAAWESCKNGLSAQHLDLRDFQTNVACTALYGSQS